jgi:hypothetical protein
MRVERSRGASLADDVSEQSVGFYVFSLVLL